MALTMRMAQIGQLDEWEDIPNTGTHDTISQRGLDTPKGMGGNNYQICVADSYNHRILVWNTLPENSDDLADIVIGQSDFTKNAWNDTDQNGVENYGVIDGRVLRLPLACDMSMEQLFIADSFNHRVLIYNALNKRPANN